jgi:ribosomal protein S18 acetylase RimI-like enzyme
MSIEPFNSHPKSTQPAVRLATLADVPTLHSLVNSAYRGESGRQGWTTESDLLEGQRTDEEQLREIILAPESRVLVAVTQAQEVIGCVHLRKKSTTTAYLGMLTTAVRTQASGVGNLLLRAAESDAQTSFGSSEVEMTVIHLRRELVAWYVKRGYRVTGERRPFPYGDERFGIPQREDLEFEVLKIELPKPTVVTTTT